MMCGKCDKVAGVLTLIAGLSFLAFGMGINYGVDAHVVSGVALSLVGLGYLAGGSMCKDCMAMSKKK